MASKRVTGLKQNSKFGGAVHQWLFIEGISESEATEFNSLIAEALAPIILKYGKCEKVQLGISKFLECEVGHRYSEDETYCVECNMINQGTTADKWRKSRKEVNARKKFCR